MIQPSKEPLHVTDHAVLRYLERHHGFDMELIRAHIAGICAAPAAFGAVCVRAEGVRFEITNGKVVTVRPDSVLPSKISLQRAQNRIARSA